MIETIKNWWMTRKLRLHKERALFEVQTDLAYLYTFKKEALHCDEDTARKRMAELKKIESPTPEQSEEMGNLINEISQSKATKNEVEKSAELVRDLENYISLL